MMGKHPCLRCKHFLEEAALGKAEIGTCEAFPDGIPYEVFAYMNLSGKPKDCNNGIGFEPEEQDTEKTA